MAKPSAKIPRITNADKPGIVADPGTLVFNDDSNLLEFINLAFGFTPIAANVNVITQQIWVNAAVGSDSNDGGINAPFASYDAARVYAKTIASPTGYVVLNVIGDQSITGDFIVSPYIIVNGNKSGVFTITGDIILDTDFLPLSSLITRIVGCSFIANAMTITWGSGDQNILVFNESDFINVPSFTEVSPNTNAFGNGVALIGSDQPFYLPFNTLFSVKDALFAASNCQLAGLPELIATGAQTPRMSFIQSGGYGQISIDGTGAAGSPIVFLRSCDPTGVNLLSTNAQLATDVVSLDNDALNFSGGATIAQVQFNTQLEPARISTSLYTPSNYTPTSPDSRVGPDSVTSHLNGIDQAIGSGALPTLGQGQLVMGVDSSPPVAGNIISLDNSVSIDGTVNGQLNLQVSTTAIDSLQDAYNSGNTIAVATGRPLQFNQISLGVVTDGVATPSTGVNNTSDNFIRGFTFVPTVNMYITAFQVEDSTLGIGQTRTMGIYQKSNQAQLLVGSVSKTDPLVGVYRTNPVASPVLLLAGVQYVLSALVPAGQIYRNMPDAVAGADLAITEWASGPNSPSPIPLSYPTTFTATANITPYGAFQYQTFSSVSQVQFTNDDASVFMEVSGNLRAAVPAPVMLDSDFILIPGKVGMSGYGSTSKRPLWFDGMSTRKGAYIDDILQGTWTPSLTNQAGTSALAYIKGQYIAPNPAVGNIVTLNLSFSLTATATLCGVNISSFPFIINNFTSVFSAVLSGGNVYTNVTPNIGDGALLDMIANTGTQSTLLTFMVANTSGTKVVNVSFTYLIE